MKTWGVNTAKLVFESYSQPSHRDDKIRKKVGWRKDPYHSVGV